MDDYSVSSLSESKNEWCARLVDILTMPVIDGLRSIFKESWELCISNDEEDKYLMTFQTLLSRIPKWNPEIIANERKRIEDVSNCSYLEDLISCVHVIQLKALTCVRVGQKQKKIDIDIPNAESFIHKIFIGRGFIHFVFVAPLSFPLQYVVEAKIRKYLFPKESYFQSLLKSIYDAESKQNLFYSMTLDSYEPYLVEKRC